ncbi:testis-expressed protein 10 isoform X2 [Microcaecilia unicolor]|uniref:Testis-expressed protein 10 isoform X2 n=1 Tax=Microcaecilia unicolor TaxID=1415580 RepID=A0A6P7Y7L0_9AMPH|nr:testis-expressed protein 10 isoform X2 [Microcaecilia unicolor]
MSSKRKRQDDFQKVKLRVGRKKPRPENVTDVGFRTKGIHLPEQLAEGEGSLLAGSRKLNIKDLLSQMHHYSPGVKQSALIGLKELLSYCPSVIDAHLSNIVSEVAAVFTDKDAIVRSAAVHFLQCLASKIPVDQIAPFFPLVSAHLSSAMTHIVEGIQEDSLKVLDVLLDKYPVLLIDRSSMLLKNFVELISHQQLSRGVKNGDTFSAWTLSVNPNRNLTSQQWRLNVLMRLKKLLELLSLASADLEGDGLLEQRENTQSCRAVLDIIWEEHTSGQQQIQVYEHGGTSPWVNSPFRLRSLGDITCIMDEGLSSAENLKGFIEMIIPLLIECWVEASPAQLSSTTPGNFLEPESHHLMQQVLSIICLLWRLVERQDKTHKMDSWLRVNYLDVFRHRFMSHFPYSLLETVKHKKKNSCRSSKHGTIPFNNLDHLLLNLTLCDIMVSLANTSTVHLDSGWLDMIRTFVTETLVDGWKLNNKQLIRLLGVTWRLMLVQQNKVASEKLIRAVYVLYQQRDLSFPIRTMLLRFFSRVYQKEDFCPHLRRSRSKVLSRWLAGLPLQLVQLRCRNTELSAQLIDMIHAAAARSNKKLLQSLQATACEIYDPQDGTLVLLPAELQKPLVHLLYFVPCISVKLLRCLHHCCVTGILTSGLAATLIGILHARSPFAGWVCYVQDSPMSDVDYFSFLFSTLAGFPEDELALLQGSKNSPHLSQTQVSPVGLYPTDLDQFAHHWAITKAVCYNLSTVPAQSQCYDILQSAISKHLAVLSVIPDSTAGSIVYAISKLQDHSTLLNDDTLKFLASCCISLLYFVMTLKKQEPEHVQKRNILWESCVSLLTVIPRVFKLMLQSLQMSRILQEELPVIAELIRHLLQHTQLRSQMIMNAVLVQQIVQDIMNLKTGEVQEQWLTDLHYCFNIYLTTHPQGAAAVGTLC